MVFLPLERSEYSLDKGLLVGHQDCSRWIKADLVPVFLWDSPLILDWNAGLILHREFLLARDSHVAGREKDLLVVEGDLRCVTVALKEDLLHVSRRVVEQELRVEVEESWRLGVELKAHK